MPILDSILAWNVAPGAPGLVGVTNFGAGDTNQVRSFDPPYGAVLLNVWHDHNANGQIRIVSPNFHDAVGGLTFDAAATTAALGPKNHMPSGAKQNLKSQDILTITQSGSAVAGEIENILLQPYYQKVGTNDANFIDEATLKVRKVDLVTLQAAIAAGVTSDYSTPTALNTFVNAGQWKANTSYALVGYEVLGSRADFNCTAITIRGADTGNYRIAMPGNYQDRNFTNNYWVYQTRTHALPLICVFSTPNQAGTIVEVVNTQAANTIQVNLIFARLA